MATGKSLAIEGYRGEPVPNTFLRQQGETVRLAILLPGLGYTCDMPLFYYAVKLLTAGGADLLAVEYAYNRRADFRDLPQSEQRRWLLADATAAYRAGLAQRAYEDVTLIGKSLGTLAMPHLLATADAFESVRAVWFTPLLSEDSVRQQLLGGREPKLVVIGIADPYYDPATLAGIQSATGREVLVVEDADHSLQVPGDVVRSVQALEQAMRGVQRLIT